MTVTVPKKVVDRLTKETRLFQRVLADAKSRDVNESDTVTILTDMLASVFGFDKYSEVTSEQAIRGTYCDLAVKIEDRVQYLIEVKAIGLPLKATHLRQAVNYGANHGVPWIVLTNGIEWEIYRVKLDRKVEHEQICTWNFLELNARRKEDRAKLFLLCREGLKKAAIQQYHEHVQTVNRYVVSAVMQSDPVLAVVRRELRRLSADAKITIEEIEMLIPDVLKREVLEGDEAVAAKRRVSRSAGKSLRKRSAKKRQAPASGLSSK